MTYHEAAQMLHVPIDTLYTWVADRRIPHKRLGPRTVRFAREDLEAWIKARHVPPIGGR